MSLTTYEIARTFEQLDENPEKVMFGKLLTELGNQSEERIRSAAKQLPVSTLRDLIYQFQVVAESRKGEQTKVLAQQILDQGLTAEDLKRYFQNQAI